MAKNIKGITIQIGAETTGLDKALKDINAKSRDINKELREVNKLLKFNPKDTEILSQKQKLLGDQIAATKEKLDRLKAAQDEVKRQYQAGEIDEGQYRAFQREVIETESKLKHYQKQLKDVNKEKNVFVQRLEAASNKLKEIGSKVQDVGKKMTLKVTTPIVALGGLATKSAIEFESAFAGVRKTVDATDAQLAELKKGIRNMSKEIPVSATAISEVAEAAGQLGIETDNVLSFTRTMIDLGEATNLSSEEAASSLAKFANITQMSQKEFDKLGSTIVALGNNLATTEADIVAMGMRLAGAGKQVGLTEAQILSFAGALSSVGIEAEAGGSAFSKVMIQMSLAAQNGTQMVKNFKVAMDSAGVTQKQVDDAMKKGGKTLDALAKKFGMTSKEFKDWQKEIDQNASALEDFAMVAGMSSEEFAKAFQEDAAGALKAFITGLQNTEDYGMSAIQVLENMGITEVRMRDALLRAASAGDVFTESLNIGTKAWEDNIALTNEAEQRYKTSEAKIAILKNTLNDLAITFGEHIAPIVTELAEKLKTLVEWFGNLSPETQKTILTVAGLAAAIGPLILIIGKIIAIIGTVTGVISTVSGAIAVVTTGAAAATPAVAGLASVFTALTGPVGIAIAAITAAIAVGVLLWKNWDKIKEFAGKLWDGIKDVFGKIGQWIGDTWNNVKNWTTEKWNNIKNAVSGTVDKIKTGISEKFNSIKNGISDSWEKAKTLTSNAWSAIKGKIQEHGGGIRGVIGTYMEGYKAVWNTGFNLMDKITGGKMSQIRDSIKNIAGNIGSALSGTWNNITSTASKAWENLKYNITHPIEFAKNTVKKAVDAILGFFRNLKIPEIKIPKIKLPAFKLEGKFSLAPPSVPKLSVKWHAKGGLLDGATLFGNIGNTLLGGGEAGNEGLVPLEGRHMYPLADAIAKRMNAKGNVTLNVYPQQLTPEELDRTFHYLNRRFGVSL